MNGVKVLVILALFAVESMTAVFAEVSHISIDTAAFESGQLPKLTVNVVTEHNDLSRLTFYLRQIYRDNIVLEKLDVERISNDVFTLSGKEQIRDPDSALIVSEYRNAKWQQYSPVALFNKDMQASTRQPVAIKKMKSSASTLSSPTSSVSSIVSAKPVLSRTQDLLEGCNINKQPNDSLWKIAVRYRKQWDSNIYGVMLALYQTNPQAFYQGKISKLQVGSLLRCPPADLLVQFNDVATDRVTFDNLVFRQSRQSPQTTTETITQVTEPVINKIADSETDNSSLVSLTPERPSEPIVSAAVAESVVDVSANVSHNSVKDELKACVIEKDAKDTLWRVAEKNKKQLETNVYGTMLALYQSNPDAFYQGKISLLKIDTTLSCPPADLLVQFKNIMADKATFDKLVTHQRGQSNRASTASMVKATEQVIAEIANNEADPSIQPVEPSVIASVEANMQTSTGVSNQLIQNDLKTCVLEKHPQDTLWRVALNNQKQLRTNVYGTMLAIYDANPQAFFKQKISLLMSDSRLICPSHSILQQYQHEAKDQATYIALELKQR